MARLGCEQAVVAEILELTGPPGHLGDIDTHHPAVDLHAPLASCSLRSRAGLKLQAYPSLREHVKVDGGLRSLGWTPGRDGTWLSEPAGIVESMGWPVPQTLSPSSMGAFTSCPLAFRFSYVQRLPEPPSAPASKGTLVHRALELLLDRPPDERVVDAALDDLARAAAELADHPEFSGLDLSTDELEQFRGDAETLVRRYFELEDPRRDPSDRARDQARGRRRQGDGPRHHRPARARRRRRARGHRLQDRQFAERTLGGEESRGRARVRAAVRAQLRPPTVAGAAPLPVAARIHHRHAHRGLGARRRVQVERGDGRGAAGVLSRRLSPSREPRSAASAASRSSAPSSAARPTRPRSCSASAPKPPRAARRCPSRACEPTERGKAGRPVSEANKRQDLRELVERIDTAAARAADRVRSPALDHVAYAIGSACDHSLLWHAIGAVRSHAPATSALRRACRARSASSRRSRTDR